MSSSQSSSSPSPLAASIRHARDLAGDFYLRFSSDLLVCFFTKNTS